MQDPDTLIPGHSSKQITIPVKRTVTIDVLENNMLVCDGVFCTSSKDFHEALKAGLAHPFTEKQKRSPRTVSTVKTDKAKK